MPKGIATDGTKGTPGTGVGRRKPSATRALAPLAPLALALLVNQAVLPGGAKEFTAKDANTPAKCEDVEDFHTCHVEYPSGCSAAGRYDAYLNILKNQVPAMPSSTAGVHYLGALAQVQNLDERTPAEVSKSNHFEFKDQLREMGEGGTWGAIGYLYYAKPSGAESSNCGLSGEDDVDYHIGIGFDPTLAGDIRKGKLTPKEKKAVTQTSMVVEMTPHYRSYYHPEWNMDAVKAVAGRRVRVVGQLMLDSEHNNKSQNCGFAAGADMVKCWRASAWELHPVTLFEVCGDPADKCSETSGNWTPLGADEKP